MRPIRFALAAVLLLAAVQANAGLMFRTTMTLSNPIGPNPPNLQLTKAVFDWETNVMSGVISSSDLGNLTMRLFDGGSLIYTDAMIVGGAAQPIGGVARTLPGGITWDFDLDTLVLVSNTAFDNDTLTVQTGATGLTYNAYTSGGDNVLTVGVYQDGVNQGTGNTWTRVTATNAVPVASTGLLLLAGLPLVARRRKAGAFRLPVSA